MATQLATAYVQIIPSAQGISGSISDALSGESKKAGESSGKSIAGALVDKLKGALKIAAVGKIIGDTIANSSEFEQSMTKAGTLFTGTANQWKDLQGTILRVSSETGMSASMLAEAAYSAESASVPVEDLGYMIEQSARLATAGFTDVDTALSATAKTMNAYGTSGSNAIATVQGVLLQTQNLGITTVGELGAALANVTPTAAAMGVSFKNVGAAMAQLTASGVPTAQATTQLRSAFAELGKTGTKAQKALANATKGTEYAGKSFQEIMAEGVSLGDVMGMLQDYADKTGVSMLDLWSSIEGGNAAMSIAKDVDKFNSNLQVMGETAGVVDDGYQKMTSTLSSAVARLKSGFKNLGIALMTGMDTSSSVAALTSSLKDIFKAVTPQIGNFIKGVFDSLPDLATGLFDLIGSIGKSLMEDVDWPAVGQSILDGIGGVLEATGQWLAGLFDTGKLAVQTINWGEVGQTIIDKIKAFFGDTGEWLASIFRSGKDAVGTIPWGEVGNQILTGVQGVLTVGGDWLSGLFNAGAEAAKAINFGEIGSTIKTTVEGALNSDGGNFLSKIFTQGESDIKGIDWAGLGQNVAEAGAAMIGLAGEELAAGFTAAEALISGINWEALGQTAASVANGLVSLTGEALAAGFTAAEALINGINWEALGQNAATAANGLINLTGETLAGAFTAAETLISNINWEGLGQNAASAANGLINLSGETLAGAFTAAESLINSIDWKGMGENAAEVANGLINLSGETLAGAFTAAESLISSINWKGIGETAAEVGNGLINLSGETLAGAFTYAESVIRGIDWDGIGQKVADGLNRGLGILSGLGDIGLGIGEIIVGAGQNGIEWVKQQLGLSGDEGSEIIKEVSGQAVEGLTSAIPELSSAADLAGDAIVEAINAKVSTEQGMTIGEALISGMASGMGTGASSIDTEIANVSNGIMLSFEGKDWASSGKAIVAKIGGGIGNAATSVAKPIAELVKGIKASITTSGWASTGSTVATDAIKGFKGQDWTASGKKAIGDLTAGFCGGFPSLVAYAGDAASATAGKFTSGGWFSAGSSLSAGIAKGILAGRSAVVNAAGMVAQAAISKFKGDLKIHSPSRVMAQLGQFIPYGLANGIESDVWRVERAVATMSDASMQMQRATYGGYQSLGMSRPAYQQQTGGVNALVMMDKTIVGRMVANEVNHVIGTQITARR